MSILKYDTWLQQYPAEHILQALSPFVTEQRKKRIEDTLAHRLHTIQLALEEPSDIHNALAAVRTSEAMGLTTVHLIAPEGTAQKAGGARSVTQGAMDWVAIQRHQTLTAFSQSLCADTLLAGADMHGTIPLSDLPIDTPICLVLGNESRGLSPAIREQCDVLYHIPMYGFSESLNLSVSAALSLYDLTTRKRTALQSPSDLTHSDAQQWKARYYLNSIKPSLHAGLIAQTNHAQHLTHT